MASARTPNIREEFDTNLKEKWIQRPICDDPDHEEIPNCDCMSFFYDTPNLERWMMQRKNGGNTNMELLMHSLDLKFPQGIGAYTPKSLIEDNHKRCILLLSCLLANGEEKWVYFFHKAGYADKNLREFETNDEPRRLRLHAELSNSGELEKTIRSIFAIFDTTKWAFCPIGFDDERELFDGDLTFHRKRILPFCARTKIKHGGTASVSAVIVQEDFIAESLREKLSTCCQLEDFGQCYELAIKSYNAKTKKGIDTFLNERQVLKNLQKVKETVRYLGSYTAHDRGGLRTRGEFHNIILEYGRMDLRESYEKIAPPQRAAEIVANWRSISNIAKAIRGIHEIHQPGGNRYDGIHGDVKPDNILLVGDELKLADFGFTSFMKHEESGDNVPGRPLGQTISYGPPETQPSNKIDMWSFGCVLSIHATWIVAGYAGVEDFEGLRHQSNKDSMKEFLTDAFHDGVNVLLQIKEWHQYLKSIVRQSDTITPQILDLVDDKLFQADPEERANARELCEDLDSIIRKEEEELKGATTNKDIERALFSGDLRRRGLSSNSQVTNSNFRSDESRKSARPPLGISQRDATLASSLKVKVPVPPRPRSGAFGTEASGSTYHVSNASHQLPAIPSKPNISTAGSLAVPIQSPVLNGDAKGKGKQHSVNATTILPDSSDHQPLANAALSDALPPVVKITHGDEPISTRIEMPEQKSQQPPVFDLTRERPRTAETDDMPEVTKTASEIDLQGRNLTMQFAMAGNLQMTKTWLKHCDITLQDNGGKTVLHHLVAWAAGRGSVTKELCGLISDIKEKGPQLFNMPDVAGRNPLYYSGRNLELMDILLDAGACVDPTSFNNAIELDLRFGSVKSVEHYLEHKADIQWVEERLEKRIKGSDAMKRLLRKSTNHGTASSQKRRTFSGFGFSKGT